MGTGSMSRSASRARPPLLSNASAGVIGTVSKDTDDDDAVEPIDRGEDLIRRRMKERKRARKEKEREKRGDMTPMLTAQGDDFGVQRGSSMPPGNGNVSGRSASTARGGSVGRRTPSTGYFGYGGESGTDTPMEPSSPRDEMRASSIYSSAMEDDEDAMTETVERAPSIIGSVVQDAIEEEEDEEDEEGSGEGDDEGVTLRDRQDVSRYTTVLIIGYQYRTSFRSTYLEACVVQEV
jgi:Ca2+:H+ antiporter